MEGQRHVGTGEEELRDGLALNLRLLRACVPETGLGDANEALRRGSGPASRPGGEVADRPALVHRVVRVPAGVRRHGPADANRLQRGGHAVGRPSRLDLVERAQRARHREGPRVLREGCGLDAEDDPSRAAKPGEPEYTVFSAKGQETAGATKLEDAEGEEREARWVPYIQVANVDAAVRSAEEMAKPQAITASVRIAVA